MAEFVYFVLLKDIPPLGKMEFTKVQWWAEWPFCVCVNYAIDGVEKEFGIRLDLDKRAFLDDLDPDIGPVSENQIEDCKSQIWDIVVDALHNKSAFYYKPAP